MTLKGFCNNEQMQNYGYFRGKDVDIKFKSNPESLFL